MSNKPGEKTPYTIREVCRRGHVRNTANSYGYLDPTGRLRRVCRVCRSTAKRAWYAQRKEAAQAQAISR